MVAVLGLSRLSAGSPVALVAGSALGRGSDVVLDEVSSTDVAAAVAEMTNMLVADKVVAQAEALASLSDLTSATEDELAKPQLVATETKSRADIVKHVVAAGETLDSLANTYNVTTDTIKWANNLQTNTVAVGTKLTILPVSGVLHTVNEGDDPDSLAQLYKANAQQIIAFNDAELKGLMPGEQIVIPSGIKPAPARGTLYATLSRGFRLFNVNSTFLGSYKQLGLAGGWCTHWASVRAAQLGLGGGTGNNWGNAISWPTSARRAGYVVDRTPVVGAVAQRNNHVVVVEAVSADGSMIKYSDQNGLAGWGRVAITNDWVPASGFANYIHR